MTDAAAAIAQGLSELREPFPPAAVGKLPKGGVQLDYVGHAAVTDRLLSTDLAWNWEPLALDEHGLPQYDAKGGLWIKLTVCGITRLGYGDGPDPKQRIGDAIRNAAMRFGVALDLWSKSELESSLTQVAEPSLPREFVPPVWIATELGQLEDKYARDHPPPDFRPAPIHDAVLAELAAARRCLRETLAELPEADRGECMRELRDRFGPPSKLGIDDVLAATNVALLWPRTEGK